MGQIIKKYPKIFQMYEGNPGGVNWSIEPGWERLIDWMCDIIQDYVDEYGISQVECTQIKEKYGELRFYYVGGDNFTDKIVDIAEELSLFFCQDCGEVNATSHSLGGWITTVCDKCYSKIMDI